MFSKKVESGFIVVAVVFVYVLGYMTIESKASCKTEPNLLDMSSDLNECVEKTRGPCCEEYADLIDEAKRIGLLINANTSCK